MNQKPRRKLQIYWLFCHLQRTHFAEAVPILFGPVMYDAADGPLTSLQTCGGDGLTSPAQTATQKKLPPHLVLQRRCILVREPCGVKSVTVSGVRTMSRAKFSEHPLIRTDVPTCSDRHALLTDKRSDTLMNSQPRSRSSCSVLWKKKILDAALINIHTSPDKKAGSVGIPLGRVDRCVSSLRCPITQLIW